MLKVDLSSKYNKYVLFHTQSTFEIVRAFVEYIDN